MFNKNITKEEINLMPLKKYEGKIIIISGPKSMAHAVSELKKHKVVGFDTEKRPAFQKGVKNQVALVQLAIPDKVFLIRLNLTGLLPDLIKIFANEDILKVGIGTADDIVSLREMANFDPSGFLDLNKITEKLGIENVGVRNLSALILGYRISKRQQVTNWERLKLTENQVNYAAMDAWVCLEIYNKLAGWGYIENHVPGE
jgi:ribonuclease D